MKIKILPPKEINSSQLEQIIELINSGGQIQVNDLKKRILSSELIAFKEEDGLIISTATIKNPISSYVNSVFSLSNTEVKPAYDKELGYIATNSNYENSGHCKDLIKNLYPYLKNMNIFATTRKASIIHILSKFDFVQTGNVYKKDLYLLLHEGVQKQFVVKI